MNSSELFYLPNIPGTEKIYRPLIEELADKEAPFETIILSLANSWSDSLTIIAEPGGSYEKVLVSLEKNKQVQGYLVISTDTLKRAYGRFEVLNENIFSYADKPGYLPDHAWFEKRAKRLRISWNDGLDSYLIPVSALPELMMSYLYSSGGMVLVKRDLIEDENTNRPFDVFKITLSFLGLKDERGFHEQYLLPVKKLKKFFEKSKGSSS